GTVTAVRFLGLGYDDFEDITLEVAHIAQWARGFGRFDGCAFCASDPLADEHCAECGGGYIHHGKTGDVPLPALAVHVAPSGKWFWQHVPHAVGCTTVTYIDRWY